MSRVWTIRLFRGSTTTKRIRRNLRAWKSQTLKWATSRYRRGWIIVFKSTTIKWSSKLTIEARVPIDKPTTLRATTWSEESIWSTSRPFGRWVDNQGPPRRLKITPTSTSSICLVNARLLWRGALTITRRVSNKWRRISAKLLPRA